MRTSARTSEAPSTPNSLQHSGGHGILWHSIRDATEMNTLGGPAIHAYLQTEDWLPSLQVTLPKVSLQV